jgi:hypothetical protein
MNMVTKVEEIKNVNKENMDILRTCEDSYTAVSKIWEDSYLKLYKPWFESTEAFFGKAFELSKDVSPEPYKEFYIEWLKTSQNSFCKFYQIPTLESNKEKFEKLLVSAEESKKIYGSWIAELERNSRATREVLKGEADPAKYKEVYDMWINSYGKMFNELLTLPLRQNMKDIFQNITSILDMYSEAFEQISKIWKDSYTKLYLPYTQSRQPSREVLEYFLQSENGNLNLYKSWMEILGQMSQKAQGLSKQGAEQEAYRELYNLWGGRHLKTSLITHPHSALLRRSWSM